MEADGIWRSPRSSKPLAVFKAAVGSIPASSEFTDLSRSIYFVPAFPAGEYG